MAQAVRRRQTRLDADTLVRKVRTGEPDGLRRAPVEAIVRRNGDLVVRLAGELDLYNAAEVGAALEQAAQDAPERLVVDLGEVTFVDSTTLATLFETKRGLQEGILLLLAAPSDDVRRALDVSGLGSQFAVHETVEAALASTA